jgi:hypothetical protein
MESNRLLSCAVATLLVSLVFTVTPLFSQTQNKVVEWSKSPIGSHNEKAAVGLQLFPQIDGVEIEDFTVAGKSITAGEPFAAGNDWLKSFTVRVKNISNQRLVKVQMTLVLPEMNFHSPDMVFCYGCAAAENEKGVMPGEVVELKMLGGDFYDWIKSRITEKGSVSRINRAEIRNMYVTLPSGPMWFSGCVKTANPRNACPRSTP